MTRIIICLKSVINSDYRKNVRQMIDTWVNHLYTVSEHQNND